MDVVVFAWVTKNEVMSILLKCPFSKKTFTATDQSILSQNYQIAWRWKGP